MLKTSLALVGMDAKRKSRPISSVAKAREADRRGLGLPYADKFEATARDTYVLSVPECLTEQRAMRDLRDAMNGRTKPRGEPRRICKCPECRKQRRLEAPRA